MVAAVSGQPDIIGDLVRIHFCRKLMVVAVYNGRVSCLRHHTAEGVGDIRQLLGGEIQDILGLDIHCQGIGNVIILRHIHCIPGRCLCLLHSPCLEIDIGRHMDAVGAGLPHVLVKIFVHGIFSLVADGRHPHQGKGNIVSRCLPPVHVSLPLGHADAPEDCAVDGLSRIVHINAVHLRPGGKRTFRTFRIFLRRCFKARADLVLIRFRRADRRHGCHTGLHKKNCGQSCCQDGFHIHDLVTFLYKRTKIYSFPYI